MYYDEFVQLHGERLWDYLVEPMQSRAYPVKVRSNANSIVHSAIIGTAIRKMVADGVLPSWPSCSIIQARIMFLKHYIIEISDDAVDEETAWRRVLTKYNLLPDPVQQQLQTHQSECEVPF